VPTPPSIPGPGQGAQTPAVGAPSNWSPPLSAPPSPASGSEPPAPPLYLVFNGQRFLVDKDQFVIGRGSKTADLAIKDGNISRKHAVVLRRNGVYYIKDLGSTNGIEYKGMRIDNKRIDEGDVFSICDYEIRFTYQG
jgi:pSer/pThr/pTyr-binding forkhead associated (FHA) protein